MDIPEDAMRAYHAVEREAPEYASAFGKFLFEQVLGVPWVDAELLDLTEGELYVPSSPASLSARKKQLSNLTKEISMSNSTAIEEEALRVVQAVVVAALDQREDVTPPAKLIIDVAAAVVEAVRMIRSATSSDAKPAPATPDAGLTEH